MAGFAKSTQFMLSGATLMLGPLEDLHELNPAQHSLGLVKNVTMTGDPSTVELTQGIQNSPVMSIRNGEGLRFSAEVYEASLRNLTYAAGLDGSGAQFDQISAIWTLNAQVTGNAAQNTLVFNTGTASGLVVGDYIFIQNGTTDEVHIAKVASVSFASPNTTITTATGFHLATGRTFPAGSRIGRVKRVDIGAATIQTELAMKIVGIMPKDGVPFTIMCPKVKISGGLGVAFQTDNFGNLPFEITPFAGVPADPFYSEYGAGIAFLFAR